MIAKLRYVLAVTAAALALSGCRDTQSHTPATSASSTEKVSPATRADAPAPPASDTATSAADVVKKYYAAIQSGDYKAAYAMWRDSGKASGKSLSQFEAGFSQTARVNVTVADSVHMEGAAGSQYATVPVLVEATLRNGFRQHFEGNYVLRRSMVDGATSEQQQWRIYSAELYQQ